MKQVKTTCVNLGSPALWHKSYAAPVNVRRVSVIHEVEIADENIAPRNALAGFVPRRNYARDDALSLSSVNAFKLQCVRPSVRKLHTRDLRGL